MTKNHTGTVHVYGEDNITTNFTTLKISLGIAYGLLGKRKEAIEAYKQVIRINPDDAEAHYLLGFFYNVLDDKGSALEQYKILKDLDSEVANELFNLIGE
jgi:tetratricopeptide (TPR) repeat protein